MTSPADIEHDIASGYGAMADRTALKVLVAGLAVAVRNAYGMLAVLAALVTVAAVCLYAPVTLQAGFGYVMTWFLLLGGVPPVIELARERAKTAFRTATHAVPVVRGRSARPLFVTAAALPVTDAARLVQHMAGRFRLPDALRSADALARTG